MTASAGSQGLASRSWACLLIAGALAGTAYYSYTVNRRDALALSQDLIEALDRRIRTQVTAWLEPAADTADVFAAAIAEDPLGPQIRDVGADRCCAAVRVLRPCTSAMRRAIS